MKSAKRSKLTKMSGSLPQGLVLALALAGTIVLSSSDASATRASSSCSANPGSKLKYRVYMAGVGWSVWYCDTDLAGSTGESRQLEAIQVMSNMPGVSACYQVHASGIGWMGSAAGNESCNGALAGTTGQSRKIEAVKVRLVGASSEMSAFYQSYVAGVGLAASAFDWAYSGTVGQSRAMEAMKLYTHSRPACPPTSPGSSGYTLGGGEGVGIAFPSVYNFATDSCSGSGGYYFYNCGGTAQCLGFASTDYSRSGSSYSFHLTGGDSMSLTLGSHSEILAGFRNGISIGSSTVGP